MPAAHAMQRPITPRMRPVRATPSPPALPRVCCGYSRPRRARRSVSSASSPDAAIAAVAWSRFTLGERLDASSAAGVTASVRIPRRIERRAYQFGLRRTLLLSVRATNGGGWDGAADEAGDGDDREHVRQRLEERRE